MNEEEVSKKEYTSVAETAKIMGYSRQHVLRLIDSGKIRAKRIGRSYVVDRDSIGGVYRGITSKEKSDIDKAVGKVFKEYGEALKKLSKE